MNNNNNNNGLLPKNLKGHLLKDGKNTSKGNMEYALC